MNALIKTSANHEVKLERLENAGLANIKQSTFLQGVIEGLIDGILIVTECGELLHANDYAHQICDELRQRDLQPRSIPQAIWSICQVLIGSRSLFPNETIIISDEISTETKVFRVRVRWLSLAHYGPPCLLVTLEDRFESLQNMALADAQKYGLTAREKDVWSLYRANYSYKEIAAKLYITLNTVKKHMKNIHAKRHALLATNSK